MEDNSQRLLAALTTYATPDKKYVGQIQKKNNKTGQTVSLDFVGHADITRMLIEIDPLWFWEPIEWVNGRPAITIINGTATMWGRLTLCGKSLVGVGSVDSSKMELDKELIGDFLRNAAMRFGICLSLWSKSEQEPARQYAGPVSPPPSLHTLAETQAQKAHGVVDPNQPKDLMGWPEELLPTVIAEAVKDFTIKDPGALASVKQLGMIRAIMQGADMSAEDRLTLASAISDRDITSLDELTKSEASKLITALKE